MSDYEWWTLGWILPGQVPMKKTGLPAGETAIGILDPNYFSTVEELTYASGYTSLGFITALTGDGTFYRNGLQQTHNQSCRERGFKTLTVDLSIQCGSSYLCRVGSLGLADSTEVSFTVSLEDLEVPPDRRFSLWFATGGLTPGPLAAPDENYATGSESVSGCQFQYFPYSQADFVLPGWHTQGNCDTLASSKSDCHTRWLLPVPPDFDQNAPFKIISSVGTINMGAGPVPVDMWIHVAGLGHSCPPIWDAIKNRFGIFYFTLIAVLVVSNESGSPSPDATAGYGDPAYAPTEPSNWGTGNFMLGMAAISTNWTGLDAPPEGSTYVLYGIDMQQFDQLCDIPEGGNPSVELAGTWVEESVATKNTSSGPGPTVPFGTLTNFGGGGMGVANQMTGSIQFSDEIVWLPPLALS